MKIYTRTGDDGTTGLFGGARVSKTDPRVGAYGTVDELNSVLGLARAELEPGNDTTTSEEGDDLGAIDATLARIQGELFVLGADLATPRDPGSKPLIERLPAASVNALESEIDHFQSRVPPLESFILPGGTRAGATLHLARTVCRRAERVVIEAREGGVDTGDVAIHYLNRLSDLLFVLGRVANHSSSVEETPWTPPRTRGKGARHAEQDVAD